MSNLMNRFAKDESGATAIEYGLIAALIAVACIASWRALGGRLVVYFNWIAANMNT
ncbi:MAG: Flp family type IVb pilin [Bosea sp.]|nr:Flp family type IVb pilin [Bosea sp. (in: a-proteobacteria)]